MNDIFAALAVMAAMPVAAAVPEPASMPGVWSIGDTKNCVDGPAWVFLADGYYAEVKLPDQGPFATGLWRDEGNAIAYSHSHMPFADMMKASELKRLVVVERSPDRLITRNYQGVVRAFSRCPTGSLKAPPARPRH